MGYVNGTNSATMSLYADSGSDTVGALKGSWNISNMGSFGSAYSPSVINVGGGVGLVAGQKYWLIADSANDAWLAWNFNNMGVNQIKYWNNNGSGSYSTNTAGTYRIDTTVVPEPVSMIALGAGLLAIARRRRSA